MLYPLSYARSTQSHFQRRDSSPDVSSSVARRPFNPDDASGAPAPDSTPARRERRFAHLAEATQLTVSQVSELIRTTLETRIASPLRVVGEVSNLNVRQHWYFSLKDESSIISCVAWASSAKKFKFTPRDGQEVVATGHISHFGPQGRTQFYISNLEPIGEGALEQRFRALCEELRTLGYFDETRRKPLPILPRRIAVITSRTGAAIQDVIATARARCPAVGIVLVDVRVQGEGSVEEVVRAIRRIDRDHRALGVDAILVTRGGGSIEDLWTFNERLVADAVHECSLPIVAAIGHESDTTIIELISDRRAATPTQAAMLLVPDRMALIRQLDHHAHRVRTLLVRHLDRERARWEAVRRHEFFRAPERIIKTRTQRLERVTIDLPRSLRGRLHDANLRLARLAHRLEAVRPMTRTAAIHARLAVLEDRLRRALIRGGRKREALAQLQSRLTLVLERHLHRTRERTEWLANRLHGVDIRTVLRRGFTYTIAADGRIIRSVRDVTAGETMTTHVVDGTIKSIVGGSGQRPRPHQAKRRASADEPPDQLDLFTPSE